jgi:hypothetical protein
LILEVDVSLPEPQRVGLGPVSTLSGRSVSIRTTDRLCSNRQLWNKVSAGRWRISPFLAGITT